MTNDKDEKFPEDVEEFYDTLPSGKRGERPGEDFSDFRGIVLPREDIDSEELNKELTNRDVLVAMIFAAFIFFMVCFLTLMMIANMSTLD